MKISPTRVTAPLVIIIQWIAVGVLMFWRVAEVQELVGAAPEWGRLPPLAFALCRPALLLPLAGVTSVAVILAECLMKTERHRFIAQLVVALVSFAYTTFTLGALFLPLIRIGEMP